MAQATAPRVVRALPGRVRLSLPGWSGRVPGALERRLLGLPGVREARANPLTGRVLIRFDPDATSEADLVAAAAVAVRAAHRAKEDSSPGSRPGHRARTVSEPTGDLRRARIPIRGLERGGHLAERVVSVLARRDGVHSARANPLTGRVLVEFDEERIALSDLVAEVAGLELPSPPGEDRPSHPLDPTPLVQSTTRAVGAAAGLGLLALRRVLGGTGPPLAGARNLAAVPGIVDGLPPLRGRLRDVLGRDAADLVIGGASVFSLTLAGSPLGLAVTGLGAWRLATEVRARREAFREYEQRLAQAAPAGPGERVQLSGGERAPLGGRVIEGAGTIIGRHSRPLPIGPGDVVTAGARLAGGPFVVDLQADPAWEPQPRPGGPPRDIGDGYLRAVGPASVAYAGLTLILTRSPTRAMAALLLVNARAALIGREAADTEASARVLRAGVTVVGTRPSFTTRRPAVLLFDGPRALADGLEVSDVKPLGDELSAGEALALASGIAAACGSPWGPVFAPGDRASATEGRFADGIATASVSGRQHRLVQSEAPSDGKPGCHWLRLERAGEPVALIGLRPRLAAGLRELTDTCQRHTVAIAIVGEHDPMSLAFAERVDLPLLAVGALEAVRASQAIGAVVALASDSAHAAPALAASDIGVGLTSGRSGRFLAPADLLAPDLNAVAAIVEAGGRRDLAARDAVLASMAGDAVGGLWGVRGAPTIPRAAQVSHVASLAAMAGAWWRLRGGHRATSVAQRLVDPHPERWGERPIDEVLEGLASSPSGLSGQQAAERHVDRRVDSAPNPLVAAVTEQLKSPLTGVLVAGAGLSLALGAFADVTMIAGVIAANAAVGTWQERRAGQAVEELERLGAASAEVLRDGVPTTLPAEELVPGDVLLLAPGDRIAADARLIEAEGLEVDEAALTGESLPVRKSPGGALPADRVVLEGSDVTVGTARAMVVAVGEGTRMGATAAAVALEGEGQTPLGTRLNAILRQGLPLVLGGGAVVALGGVLWGRPLMPQLALGASIAIAAVPEGLPLLTGVAQAAVARRLARRRALVRRLSAVEALGRVDIACADKTGTLTTGRLSVTTVADLEQQAAPDPAMPVLLRDALLAAALASPHPESNDADSHPTDIAVVAAARAAGLGQDVSARREAELPFDPGRSFHAARVDGRLVAKGAVEVLVKHCAQLRRGAGAQPLDADTRRRLEARAEELAGAGLRVLMVAEGPPETALDDPQRLTVLGFVGIGDPVRESVPAAIRRCQEAGVRVVMLTGDHPATARAIARDAGLPDEAPHVLTGPELAELDNEALDRRLERATVIARITPLDKVRIVERLQAGGHTVAMTGDGVNDAPALRLADVGVAMGAHGTEVARQAADVVLADDDFSTLAEALVEGRGFWLNIRRALALLLGGNLGELGLMVGASAIGHAAPMTTRQILAVNLFSDVLPAVAIAVQAPEHRHLSALAREGATDMDSRLRVDVVRRGIATSTPAFAAYILASRVMTPIQAQTVAFASIVSTQLAQTWDLGRAEGTLSHSVLGAVLGTGAMVGAAIALPPFNRFLGFALPSPLGLALIAAASGAAVVLGRMRPDQLGARRIAGWLPEPDLAGTR